MACNINGVLSSIYPTETIPYKDKKTGEDKHIYQRFFVLKFPGYKDFSDTYHKFMLKGEAKCALIDSFAVGQRVEVDFKPSANVYLNKQGVTEYYNQSIVFGIREYNSNGGGITPKNDEIEYHYKPTKTYSSVKEMYQDSIQDNTTEDDLPF